MRDLTATEFVELVAKHRIPRVTIAALAYVQPWEISAFTNGYPTLDETKVRSISETTRELVAFVNAQAFPPSLSVKHLDRLREEVGKFRIDIIQTHGANAKYVWAEQKPEAQEVKVGE